LRGRILSSNPGLQNDLLNAAQISRLDGALTALLRRVGPMDEAPLSIKIVWGYRGTGLAGAE
jgi:hypothetical protein